MKQRQIIKASVLIFVTGMLLVMVMGIRGQGTAVAIGDEAADFELESYDGEIHRLSDYHGEVVVLSFFSTWCKPCESAAPKFIEFREKYDDDMVFFTIVKAESKNSMTRFIDRTGYVNPYLMDFDLSVSNSFGIIGQPETIVIDKEGIITDHFIGSPPFDLLAKRVSDLNKE